MFTVAAVQKFCRVAVAHLVEALRIGERDIARHQDVRFDARGPRGVAFASANCVRMRTTEPVKQRRPSLKANGVVALLGRCKSACT